MSYNRHWHENVARRARAVLHSALCEPDTRAAALAYARLALKKLEGQKDLHESVSVLYDKYFNLFRKEGV